MQIIFANGNEIMLYDKIDALEDKHGVNTTIYMCIATLTKGQQNLAI